MRVSLEHPKLTLGRGLTRGLTHDELDALENVLSDARARAGRAASRRVDGAQLVDEVQWSADLVTLLTHDARARLEGDGTIGSVQAAQREQFAARLAVLTDHYRELWLARNRPGGLDDSVSWLDNLHRSYVTGSPDTEWGGWHVKA